MKWASMFIRRRWRSVLAFASIAIVILILRAADQIASPPRRQLMDYHREFLTQSAAHGMRIDRFTANDGTPCLVCSPQPSGLLGERGIRIRQQLTERGMMLRPAGEITGNLVLLHGRTGRREDYLPIAERLCAAGFRCLIPDLPAHGDHPVGTVTYGLRESMLPSVILNEASAQLGFERYPAGLLGMSMGGSVAVHSATQPDAPWKSLVVISSFDSFPVAVEAQASRYAGK